MLYWASAKVKILVAEVSQLKPNFNKPIQVIFSHFNECEDFKCSLAKQPKVHYLFSQLVSSLAFVEIKSP